MSEEIYHQAIKELAQAAHGAGRLPSPTASARLDNALCGDRVTVDLRSENGRITALAQETKGCLLCRAAASLLARKAPGSAPADIARALAALRDLLQGKPAEPALWPDLSLFAPVGPHKSRHGCVLLPFQAAQQAIEAAACRQR
ncbi:MAG: iron-sulfur cluster assembly scaffold protein [Azonexus sp.]|jgi:NifU-like protein involved in Fe-S cluster formation|nr:iron-sulfur cluster assembly scaffold protein [Azonexus sp.]